MTSKFMVHVYFPTASNPLEIQCGIPQFNLILTLSTWRQHQIPQLRAPSYKTVPSPSDGTRKSRLSVTCASDPQAIDWRFQRSLPWVQLICQSGSQNSEKHVSQQITGLLQRDITQGQSDGRDAQGKVRSFHAFSEIHSPLISMCLPTQKLFTPSPLRFLWRLHYTGTTDQITGHWRLNSISNHSSLP